MLFINAHLDLAEGNGEGRCWGKATDDWSRDEINQKTYTHTKVGKKEGMIESKVRAYQGGLNFRGGGGRVLTFSLWHHSWASLI